MNTDFERLLMLHVAPQLQPLGYAYEARLRSDDELYGFRKALGDDVHAIIQFWYRQDGTQHDFTVNLFTAKSSEIQPRLYGGYAGARGARLGYVMWFVNEVREYAVSDYWWVALDAAQLPTALEEATGHIVRYGAPWLEDAQALKPWEMPPHCAGDFCEAVEDEMALEMERLGYQLKQQSSSGNVPCCFFARDLPDGTCALIELQAIYSLDPHEFNFDVRLQRRVDSDPLAFDGNYGHWRSTSLAQLVWQARSSVPLDRSSVPDVKTLLWHYRDRAELGAQLRDALAQIKRLGVAWVEQAAY